MGISPRFDVRKLSDDIAGRGWQPVDLARAAGVTEATVSRVLAGTRFNPKTWARLAAALGHTNRRYLLAQRSRVA